MMHEKLPTDSFMLLSYINMKLRDNDYDSLESLCEDLGVNRDELIEKLRAVGFEYNPEQKKFW